VNNKESTKIRSQEVSDINLFVNGYSWEGHGTTADKQQVAP